MIEDIPTLEHTSMSYLVRLPPHFRLIIYKWVYKIKTCSDGSLERYKVHLVAYGFNRIMHSHAYDDTFTHVAHMTIFWTLLAMDFVRLGLCLSLMSRIMVSCVSRFIYSHHSGILFYGLKQASHA
jgi:hypothetical protein